MEELRGKFSFLANSYYSPFSVTITRLWNYNFPTVEHFYQASKAQNPNDFKKILFAPTAVKARKFGNNIVRIKNWTEIKEEIMHRGIYEKFLQNPYLARQLLFTWDETIIAGNFWGDSFWGYDMKKRIGENKLGILIMLVRDEMKKIQRGKKADEGKEINLKDQREKNEKISEVK